MYRLIWGSGSPTSYCTSPSMAPASCSCLAVGSDNRPQLPRAFVLCDNVPPASSIPHVVLKTRTASTMGRPSARTQAACYTHALRPHLCLPNLGLCAPRRNLDNRDGDTCASLVYRSDIRSVSDMPNSENNLKDPSLQAVRCHRPVEHKCILCVYPHSEAVPPTLGTTPASGGHTRNRGSCSSRVRRPQCGVSR